MPIELPRGLPFAVDTWTAASAVKRHRFLTHAHRDHIAGITATNVAAVYASRLTILIACHIFPQLDRADAFVEVELGAPVLVPDPDGDFTVTAFDANHCPGAVMFLFEGASFGRVLHTGDCRLTPDFRFLAADYVFLDCTFAACSLHFPSKDDSIRQVINCIWKHPNAPVVYLVSDMLGQEEILMEVSKVFGSKIYVDRDKNSECYHTLSLVAPEILTDDSSSRFQVIGFPRLSERATEMLALARAKHQPEPLIIRASSQWYAYYEPPEGSTKRKPALTEPMRDEFGVWHVCFSMHSSREELEQALRFIQPKWVISTTPPCMAIELSYVKKHCFASRLRNDDPLWKLLRLSDGNSAVSGSPLAVPTVEMIKKCEEEEVTCSVKDSFSSDGIRMRDQEPTLEDFEINVEPPVTLFGIARFGLTEEPELWKDEHESVEIDELKVQMENSATECEQWKDGISVLGSEVIDSVEIVAKEQDSAIESEQLKDCEPKDGTKATDVTEVEVNEHTSCTESVLWKMDRSDECVTTKRGEFEAEEQKFTGRYQFWKICKPKEMEGAKLTVQGKNTVEALDQVLAIDRLAYLHDNNQEVTKEGIAPSETDQENSKVPDKGSSDSSNAIGSSKGLNANLRKLYRSMNVPVPRPLPSLVELMAASKRPRVSPAVQL
ncbi:uncharacterized protein [Oryza sativa Japonica Group]|uniref:DNA ligase-like n=3 Tax=Oryza TaxID=4527 RepID=Q0J8K2_ORYSJ|nr:uncharacterized protein LOC4344459 [Oryza sativa Japonica Group]BAD09392.1 DNA ligase-like [Oryza sativa Japonica Group]BAF22713.1 Os08g0107600 [Oryza sativa Japonica Group]BAG99609.1 unnamed protein product [Oryza sativa Japonica Group]BAT03466.1 Os08g0107600 [Oryza sativa Japonica Group]|eukprot:NP_001060799.1 Os08g0107600 [Oryza sativa Japonica Group]